MSEEEKIKARERSRKYYQAHKKEILAKQYLYKKKKYKEDQEYRKKVYENHRRYVEKNRDKVYLLKREWQIKNRGYSTKNEIIRDLQQRIDKTIKKLESIRAFGLRSGKTLFSVLINESIEILKGDE